jgi:hypothetical protein
MAHPALWIVLAAVALTALVSFLGKKPDPNYDKHCSEIDEQLDAAEEARRRAR